MEHTKVPCSSRGAFAAALCLTFLIATGEAAAQLGLVDSLQKVLHNTTDSTQRAELLIKIGDEIFYQQLDSAIACFDRARSYAQAADAKASRAKLVMRQGLVHDFRKENELATFFLDSALAMAEAMDDQVLVSDFHHSRGGLYKAQGRYDAALGECYQARTAALLAKDDRSLMISIHDLSLMLKIEGRGEEAARMMREASDLAKKLEDHEWIMDIEGHLGEDAQANGDMDGAIAHFTHALEFAERKKDLGNTVWNMDRIGVVLTEQDRLKEAMGWFQRIVVATKDEPRFSVTAHDHIGAVLLKQGRPHEALRHYLITDSLFKLEPMPSEEAAQHLAGLAKTYAALGQFEMAYVIAARSHAMKDSLVQARQLNDLTQLRMQTEFERTRQAEQVQQQHRDELGAAELGRQRLVRNISMAGAGMIAMLLLLVERQRRRAKAALRQAEHSEQAKHRFLANMSHEIRTPMNAILGMTGILKRNEHLPDQKKYLDAVAQSSENLLVILNDILDMSKIEAGKIELERVPFDPRSVIGNVQDILQFKAREKGLELAVEIDDHLPMSLIGDPTRLQQVLINLAGNAIKFTDRGSVTIRARCSVDPSGRPDNTILLLDVIDTGIGIPLEKQDKIFEEFDQAYSDTTRKYGGTGLGLSISKRLVELQGGSIAVQSSKGEGSTFTVAIPYASTAMGPKSAAPSGVCGLKDLRILLAEDNEFNVMVAQDELADAIPGSTIDVAANGAIAVKMMQDKDYDLVLMDVQMPEMNGYDATRAIRALPGRKSRTPIVAMTANVMKEEIERCMEAGMDGYIPKPFKREELMSALMATR